MKTIKAWGSSTQRVDSDCLTVFEIEVVAGGYCSKHIHQRKSNGFTVEQGELTVRIWVTVDYKAEVVLSPSSGCLIIPPNIPHQFISETGCRAFEIYFKQEGEVEPLSEDIIRYSVGGLR